MELVKSVYDILWFVAKEKDYDKEMNYNKDVQRTIRNNKKSFEQVILELIRFQKHLYKSFDDVDITGNRYWLPKCLYISDCMKNRAVL